MCGIQIVTGLHLDLGIEICTMDLEHGVRLIGRVKDIIEESPKDPENREPVFVNPAIQARLEYGRENEKDSLL